MIKEKKGVKLFALFTLIVIFADELFLGIISITGASLESGMKARMASVISLIAYSMLFCDFLRHKLSHKNAIQLAVVLVILVLYYITGKVYPNNKEAYHHYISYFLSYGATSIPACIVGMRLAKSGFELAINRCLPYFAFAIVMIVGYSVFNAYLTGIWLSADEENIFNYQNASYYLSFCYSYCFVYVFFRERNSYRISKPVWVAMIALMLICAVGCLIGGGRGAFGFLVIITFYLLFRLSKRKEQGQKKFILIFFLTLLIVYFIAQTLNVFESSGFMRIIENLGLDDGREELWGKAMESFYESPLFGNGIGSIWWTAGFYSHNMLMDLLSETGVVGTIIVLYVLIKMFVQLNRRSSRSWIDLFILVVFISALVHVTFSGYWLSSPKLFLTFGYVFALQTNKTIISN